MSHCVIDKLLDNSIVYPIESDIVYIETWTIASRPSHCKSKVIGSVNRSYHLLKWKLSELVLDNRFEVEDELVVKVDQKRFFVCVVDWVVIR